MTGSMKSLLQKYGNDLLNHESYLFLQHTQYALFVQSETSGQFHNNILQCFEKIFDLLLIYFSFCVCH